MFEDTEMPTTLPVHDGRYNSWGLRQRLQDFFDRVKFNNYNNLASDITILINNTFNDVDVNPVTLETACSTDGEIINYFVDSEALWDNGVSTSTIENTSERDDEYGTSDASTALKVYEVMAREIDNMISRNVESTSEDGMVPDNSYDSLDAQYTQVAEAFWNNLQQGDSVFVEGSFNIPTKTGDRTYESTDRNNGTSSYQPVGEGNLPVILQFVHSTVTQTYNYS